MPSVLLVTGATSLRAIDPCRGKGHQPARNSLVSPLSWGVDRQDGPSRADYPSGGVAFWRDPHAWSHGVEALDADRFQPAGEPETSDGTAITFWDGGSTITTGRFGRASRTATPGPPLPSS